MEEFIRQNLVIFLLLVLWSLYWKGMALWRAAQLKHKKWFLSLLVVNTAGILEMLYLFVFSKKRTSDSTGS